MRAVTVIVLFVLAAFPAQAQVILDPIGRLASPDGLSEIAAFDPVTQRLFVVNGSDTLRVLSLADPTHPVEDSIHPIDLSPYGDGANSVALKNGLVAVAVQADPVTDPGLVVFFDTDGNFLKQMTAGALADMLTFNEDGSLVFVANEAEPDDGVDPEGSVSIVNLSDGLTSCTVATATFGAFNDRIEYLRNRGVRLW